MNILQIVPEMKVGGVERGTADFARVLVKEHHKAVVISAGGPLADALRSDRIKHYTLPVHKKNPFTIMRMVWQVAKIIDRESIDIVHARSRVPAIIGFFACRNTKATFITTCHGHYSVKLTSRVMGWGKLVIVGSQMIGQHMVERFGVPFNRIRVVPRGVDLGAFQFHEAREYPAGDWVIGLVARMTPLKGHEYFLRAVAKLIRTRSNIKIMIVGDAPLNKQAYKDELLLLTRRLGLERFVEFCGNRSDVPELLKMFDMLVLPTVEPEAFGRVLIEAGACGVPVIATKVGGVVEVIEDRRTGRLVHPQDSDELALAMSETLKDRKQAIAYAHTFRRIIEEKYSLVHMAHEILKVYEEALELKKILVVKFGAVGDVVLITPSLRALRKHYPNAHITIVVGKASSGIVRRCPYVNDVITYDWLGKDNGPIGFMKLARRLCRESFDMSIDFQNNKPSHLLSFVSGIPKRYGYKNKKLGFLLNHGTPDIKKNMTPVDHQFRLLNSLGISPESDALELWVHPEDDKSVERFFAGAWVSADPVLVGMHIGGSRRWATKRWPLENFIRLADELAKQNIRSVIIGGQDDLGVARNFTMRTRAKPIIAVGKTSIIETAALISRCKVFLSGDSAPLHIAASVGVPVVTLFGPTDPRRHMPPHKKGVVLHKDLPCSPCYKTHCEKNDHKCLRSITVNEVLKAIKEML